MSIIEKRILYNINEVTMYLQQLGFIISNNKILWSYAETGAACYWKIENNIITFQRSDGENAFTHNLVDFDMENRPKCAIVSIKLQDNGIALYMGMIEENVNISQITVCSDENNTVLYNGLVVLSPPEKDTHWYYGWNNGKVDTSVVGQNPYRTYWSLDNGYNNYEYNDGSNCQISARPILALEHNIVISNIYLNTGYWSKNIYMQTMGNPTAPSSIFKLQGQKYINFCTSINQYRCPVYKLAADPIEQNLSTSTDPYSSLRTYVVGDYCTFNGYVYRCTTAIQTPEPFDDSKWVQTTVPNELLTAGDHIYGA